MVLKFGVAMKQFKFNVLARFFVSRKITVVFLTALKNFKIGIHSDIYKPTGFKRGMMIGITKLNILILFHVTLTLIEGRRNTGKQRFLCLLTPKVFYGFSCDLAYC